MVAKIDPFKLRTTLRHADGSKARAHFFVHEGDERVSMTLNAELARRLQAEVEGREIRVKWDLYDGPIEGMKFVSELPDGYELPEGYDLRAAA